VDAALAPIWRQIGSAGPAGPPRAVLGRGVL